MHVYLFLMMTSALRIEQDKNKEMSQEHEARCVFLETTLENEKRRMEESQLLLREEWESKNRDLQVLKTTITIDCFSAPWRLHSHRH